VAGARVDIWRIPETRWIPLPEGPPLMTLATDATGRCGELLEGELFVLVARSPEGGASGMGGGRRSEAVDLGDGWRGFVVAMRSHAHVSGRVLDGDGRPAAGATVFFGVSGGRPDEASRNRSGQIETDAEGRFQLDPESGDRLMLWATQRDAITAYESITLEPGATCDVTLRLTKPA
jgi:hypothetical protein